MDAVSRRVRELVVEEKAHQRDESDRAYERAMVYLNAAVLVAMEVVSDTAKFPPAERRSALVRDPATGADAPAPLLALVSMLHDAMLEFAGEEGLRTRNAVSRLCEQWFVQGRPGASLAIVCALLHLVQAVSEEAGGRQSAQQPQQPQQQQQTYLRRLVAVRAALYNIDIDDPSSSVFREQLLRLFANQQVLRSAEGQRLLAVVLTLSGSLLGDAHNTVKGQLVNCKKSVLLYVRAGAGG